jgi:N-acylneuraminate cytidylyltransferase
MQAGEADTLLSVCRFPFPVQRALSRADDGSLAMMYPQYQNTRSQDLAEAYHDAAQFAWWTREALLQGAARSSSYIVDRWRVQDIDSEEDWQQAELIYQAWQMRRPCHD